MTIPYVFIAEDRGLRILIDLGDTDIYYLHSMIASTRGYVRTHRDIVLRFLRGYLEGIAIFKQNKKDSLDILKKKLRVSTEQERTLERSYDLLVAKYYEVMPYPSVRGVETLLSFLDKENSKAKSADPLPYGLHGTSIPEKMTTTQSIGGLRLANWDIVRAMRLLPQGTPLQWKQR